MIEGRRAPPPSAPPPLEGCQWHPSGWPADGERTWQHSVLALCFRVPRGELVAKAL
jgi:hypothetical protein